MDGFIMSLVSYDWISAVDYGKQPDNMDEHEWADAVLDDEEDRRLTEELDKIEQSQVSTRRPRPKHLSMEEMSAIINADHARIARDLAAIREGRDDDLLHLGAEAPLSAEEEQELSVLLHQSNPELADQYDRDMQARHERDREDSTPANASRKDPEFSEAAGNTGVSTDEFAIIAGFEDDADSLG